MADEVELTIVTMGFRTDKPEALMPMLAKYAVLSRGHHGCRNIDLCASVANPGRFVLIEKWEAPEAQQAHFDSPDMVEMAKACTGVLSAPPGINRIFSIIRLSDQSLAA